MLIKVSCSFLTYVNKWPIQTTSQLTYACDRLNWPWALKQSSWIKFKSNMEPETIFSAKKRPNQRFSSFRLIKKLLGLKNLFFLLSNLRYNSSVLRIFAPEKLKAGRIVEFSFFSIFPPFKAFYKVFVLRIKRRINRFELNWLLCLYA